MEGAESGVCGYFGAHRFDRIDRRFDLGVNRLFGFFLSHLFGLGFRRLRLDLLKRFGLHDFNA